MQARRRNTIQRLSEDTSGAAFVEYVVLMLLVSVITAAATYALGRPFVDYFRFAQTMLAVPFP